MFRSNDEGERDNLGGVDETVIGHSIKIEGDLVSNGSIAVEGEVIGSIKTEQTLKIGAQAKVTAEVKAQSAIISGKVEGNIVVEDKLDLNESAEVTGDITAKVVSIAAGAVFNGKCTMGGGKKVSEKVSAEA